MTEPCLWIDDLRVAPPGWDWAKTSNEAIELLQNKKYSRASFDHDLGGDDTTRAVVLWLCENPGQWPDVCSVHSMNPVGVEWLKGMIGRYHV